MDHDSCSTAAGTALIDVEYVRERLVQFDQVMPHLSLVGCYTAAAAEAANAAEAVECLAELGCSESFLLHIDTSPPSGGAAARSRLPARLLRWSGGSAQLSAFAIAAEGAEAAALNDIARAASATDAVRVPAAAEHLQRSVHALRAMLGRIDAVIAAIDAGTMSPQQRRLAAALAAALPASSQTAAPAAGPADAVKLRAMRSLLAARSSAARGVSLAAAADAADDAGLVDAFAADDQARSRRR